jgi:hypothetical protein
MAVRKDILQDSDGDLLIRDGDFIIGESDSMHVQDTILAHPGWWKEHPQDGVGISNYDHATGAEQELARKIKIELENDGYSVNNPRVAFINDELTISPNATRV